MQKVTPFLSFDGLINDPDQERARRAMEAVMKMIKLDIAELERAADAG